MNRSQIINDGIAKADNTRVEMDLITRVEYFALFIAVFLVFSFNYDEEGIGKLLTNGSMIAFMVIETLAMLSRKRAHFHPSVVFSVIFLMIGILSMIWSVDLERTISKIQSMTILICWFFFLVNFVLADEGPRNRVEFLMKTIILSSLFACLFLLTKSNWRLGERANGIIGDSNQAGAYLCYSLVVGLYSMKKHLVPVPLVVVQALAIVAASVVSGSRTTIFTAVLVIVLFWIIDAIASRELFSPKSLVIVVVFVIGIFFLYDFIMNNPIAYEILGRRIQSLFEILSGKESNTHEMSYYLRGTLRSMAVQLWMESPLTGKGLDTFPHYAARIYRPVFCHNNYAEILEGVGIFGFIASYMQYVIPALKIRKANSDDLALGITLLVGIAIFHYLVVFYYQKLEFVFLALLIGLFTSDPMIGNQITLRRQL